jgi:hypothetical protein
MMSGQRISKNCICLPVDQVLSTPAKQFKAHQALQNWYQVTSNALNSREQLFPSVLKSTAKDESHCTLA